MICPCCDRSPCICRFCGVCNDHLRHYNNDIYCANCAEELQVTQDGRWRIVTATALLPIDLPLGEQIRASSRMRVAVTDIAAVYQVNKEAP